MSHEELNRGNSVKDTPWFQKASLLWQYKERHYFSHSQENTYTLTGSVWALVFSLCNKTRILWPQAISSKFTQREMLLNMNEKFFFMVEMKTKQLVWKGLFSVKFILACNIASYTFILLSTTSWLGDYLPLLREARKESVVNNKTWWHSSAVFRVMYLLPSFWQLWWFKFIVGLTCLFQKIKAIL